MADTNTNLQFLDLAGLERYDQLIKDYVDSAINLVDEDVAVSLKGVTLTDDGVLQFWKDYPYENVDGISPAIELTLPKEDLDVFMKLVENATKGNVASFGDNGQVVDANIKVEDLVVKSELDDIYDYIGSIPEGSEATTIVSWVEKRTEGIATDDALKSLTKRVEDVEDVTETIKGDYLKAVDKTELSGLVTAEKERAEGIEQGLETRLKAVEDDYLKSEDKTTLENRIKNVEDDVLDVQGNISTLIGDDTGKSARTIANEELAAQLIPENAKESLNTLLEIATWIQDHPEDASEMNKAISDLENLVGTLPTDITATTIVGYIQELVNAEKTAREDADDGLNNRILDLEASVGESGEVTNAINQAKVDAVKDAKDYADDLNDAMDGRVKALEAVDHEHTNKALLDTYTQTEENLADAVSKKHEHSNAAELNKIVDGDVAKWNAASGDAHTHSNSAELNKIVSGDVDKWNAAEQNAKDYADDLNDAMNGRMTTVEDSLKEGGATATAIANAQSAADKAQEDIDTFINDTYAQDKQALQNAINEIKAIEISTIEGLFAQS